MFARYPVPCVVPGSLSIMPCPPARALERILDDLKKDGMNVVLSMLPPAEAAKLGVAEESTNCAARDLTFLTHPIADFHLPDTAEFSELIQTLVDRLNAGERIAVHCRAGIGRSGMVAACVLIALGNSASKAITIVSDARGVSIPDTVEQADFISLFEQQFKSGTGAKPLFL